MIIPTFSSIKRDLEAPIAKTKIGLDFKKTLTDSVNTRFASIKDKPLPCMATLLDPRCKAVDSDGPMAVLAQTEMLKRMRNLRSEWDVHVVDVTEEDVVEWTAWTGCLGTSTRTTLVPNQREL